MKSFDPSSWRADVTTLLASADVTTLLASADVEPSVRLLTFSNDAEVEKWRIRGHTRLGAYSCPDLVALEYTVRLTQLATVGDRWLRNCTSLTALDCAGLTQLATVGHYWL